MDLPSLDSFATRKEFNTWKQQQSSFTNRSNLHYQFKKNKYDVVASKKRLNDIERETKEAQRRADEVIKKVENLPFNVGGKKNSSLKERMALLGESNVTGIHKPKDFDFGKIQSQWQLRKKEESLKQKNEPSYYDERSERMKENYVEKLLETFNSDANALAEKLRAMDGWDFYNMYLMEANIDFDFLYIESATQNNEMVSKIDSYVDKYQQTDNDLKNF